MAIYRSENHGPPFAVIKTESSRYDLWATNIAALQDAYLPSSLEYRIREDASARGVIKKALAYLEESLQLGKPTFMSTRDLVQEVCCQS